MSGAFHYLLLNILFKVKPSSDKVFTVNDEIRIALLGKTGAGKSQTGNTIVAGKAFKSKATGKSVTQECEIATVVRGDKKIILVDTPGLFDTKLPLDVTKKEIAKCVTISSPGVHCFLVVIDAGRRFTKEESETVDHILKMFGGNSYRYLIVLFTRIDQLDEDLSDEENFREYLKDAPDDLENFLRKCDYRCIGFNNRAAAEVKESQVVRLLGIIEEMIRKNGGNCFSSALYEQTERKIKEAIEQEREKEIRKANEEREKLLNKIKAEQEKVLKQKYEEEMKQMQKQQKEEKEKQEEELRSQIRDATQRNDRSWFGGVIDYVLSFFK